MQLHWPLRASATPPGSLAGIGCPSSKVPDLVRARLSLKTVCPGGGVFLQGVRDGSERPSALLLVSSDWGWQPASGRRSCRGTVTPPGPIEIHLANQKRRLETRRLLSLNLTVPGKSCSRSRGPVVNHHTANPRTLVGSHGGRGHARRRDLKGEGLVKGARKLTHRTRNDPCRSQ